MSNTQEYSKLNQHENDIYIQEMKNKKRKRRCIICVLFSLLTFLLCFFLIPRSPNVYFENLKIENNDSFIGKFNLKNNNYYTVSWKDTDILLYWIPYSGQTVGEICYGDDDTPCESGKYFNNMCAIKIGEFKSSQKFKTSMQSSKDIDIDMLFPDKQSLSCSAWMLLNPYDNKPQRLLTMGKIKAESSIKNFGNINVQKSYYYLEV